MNTFSYFKEGVLSEKDKNSEEYLKNTVDLAIAELVFDKDYLRKAYNYYNCVRDKDQFRHLEENFGIGNPTSIEFIPLVKRHIDALIGELLQTKLKPKITCKDSETLSLIERQKQQAIYNSEINRLKQQLYDNINYAFSEEKMFKNPPTDSATEEEIEKLKDATNRDFISEFEIAAQNLIEFFLQSREIDLNTRRRDLFKDILIGGQCYYRTFVRKGSPIPCTEVLNPFDVFPEININSPYVKDSRRVVYVKYMSREEIINEFGDELSKEDLDLLSSVNLDAYTHNVYYIRAQSGGIVSNVETTIPGTYPYYNDRDYSINKYPVYYVEWLANNKVDGVDGECYRFDRYKGVRIGGEIYLCLGKDKNVVRSVESPYRCSLTINGIQLTNRSGKPFSLCLATANLQDKYDILHFYRDNLIANSGVKGDWLDVSLLPTFLGTTPQERLLKWDAYKKQGKALFNSAQEGRGIPLNTTFAGYDDTVPATSLQGIQLAIQQTEEICSSITGVFREKLGDIEQRDAVTNVQVGMHNSAVITKQYFHAMDSIMKELLTDLLNLAKSNIKEDFTGSLILGDRLLKIFKIIPEHVSFTDYDIHIGDSSDIIRDIETIKAVTTELIKGGLVGPEVLFETITTESLTEFKEVGLKAVRKKKEEDGVLQQLQQQLAQYEQQFKELQAQNQKLQSKVSEESAAKLQIQKDELAIKEKIDTRKLDQDKEFKDKDLEYKDKQLKAEVLQMADQNPKNNEIKNIF